MNVSVTWTAALQNPSIQASLMPFSGSAPSLDIAVLGNQGSCSGSSIAAGYYTLTLQLLENGFPVMGAVEVVRIVSGQTTSGAYDFSNVNRGTVAVNITPALANPILMSISGVPSTVERGTIVTAAALVGDGTPSAVYVWYLNGVFQANGPTCAFGSDLNTGYYRLDATAFTADGKRAGSASAEFQVTKAGSGGPEYFASFKFDGTPVIFTEGILEFGNVPLAGPETGWEHDGHVYDRTHIFALQVGMPRELMSDNATQLEITLIGEPGTQPPPEGTYTFSDGVHEIHDVIYASPDFKYSVYDKGGNFGSATVTITSAGGDGFIEGTFSAIVLDKYTGAPHSITDGAFRVKSS